jgi:hypothetical protein
MSKEVAAAVLTQVYFEAKGDAATQLESHINLGTGNRGKAPEPGAIELIYAVYKQFLDKG